MILTILVEAPPLGRLAGQAGLVGWGSVPGVVEAVADSLRFRHAAAVALYVVGCWRQHEAIVHLASLRGGGNGGGGGKVCVCSPPSPTPIAFGPITKSDLARSPPSSHRAHARTPTARFPATPGGRRWQEHVRHTDGGVVPTCVLPALPGRAARLRLLRPPRGLQGAGPRPGVPGGVLVCAREPGARRRPGGRVVPAEVRGLPQGAEEARPGGVVNGPACSKQTPWF